ncbi:MAG: glycosyltransferase family 9 protein [Chthoniobacterales bacterium]
MKVLILKVNQLGDNLIFLPVVQSLVQRLAREQVHLYTTDLARQLYENFLPSENIHAYSKDRFNQSWKHPGFFLRLIQEIRSIRADMVLLPYDQGNAARLLALFSGAKYRVGVKNPRTRTNWCLNHGIEAEASMPAAERDWVLLGEIANILGFDDVEKSPPAPGITSLLEDLSEMSSRRVMIHAGASREYKQWPMERFVALASRLIEEGFEVVWAEQKNDEEKNLSSSVHFLAAGSLRDFIRELGKCRYFIGNNSGPMNLANALGLASLIFSGPSPTIWDPYWHQDRIINLRLPELSCQPCDTLIAPVNFCQNKEEPMACMKRWSVESVFAEFEKLVKKAEQRVGA